MRVVGLAAQDECRLSATTPERILIAPVDNFATCALTPPGMHSMTNMFFRKLHRVRGKYMLYVRDKVKSASLVPIREGA